MALQSFSFIAYKKSYTAVIIIFLGLVSISGYPQNTANDHIKNGIAKAKQQAYKEAIQDFSKEIKLHPDSSKAYIYRAYAKEAILDYKGALQDYDKAILLKPDNAEIYNDRALAKYTSGDLKSACLDWKKSVDLGLPDAAYMIKQYCK